MSHYDECREGYCGVCGQAEGHCEHTQKARADMQTIWETPNYCKHCAEHLAAEWVCCPTCGTPQYPEKYHNLTPEQVVEMQKDNARMQDWVNDLQSGMYVNCVYCGHRYGPEDQVPTSMADALKEHIEHCPKHPMSALKAENDQLKAALSERGMHHV